MEITNKIAEASGKPIVEEPSGHVQGQYHRLDDGSLETEVGEFLYGLVRVVKPENILETGSYQGVSTTYLASALKENGKGRIETIEWENSHLEKAKALWIKLGLGDLITEHGMSSLDFNTDKIYDLVLLDTEPQTRFTELVKFWNNIKPGGIIVIHDLSWDLGSGAPQFWLHRELIEEKIKSHELQVIHFKTPRGLTLLRKTDKDDFVYKFLNGQR